MLNKTIFDKERNDNGKLAKTFEQQQNKLAIQERKNLKEALKYIYSKWWKRKKGIKGNDEEKKKAIHGQFAICQGRDFPSWRPKRNRRRLLLQRYVYVYKTYIG